MIALNSATMITLMGQIFWQSVVTLCHFGQVYNVGPCNTGICSRIKSTSISGLVKKYSATYKHAIRLVAKYIDGIDEKENFITAEVSHRTCALNNSIWVVNL